MARELAILVTAKNLASRTLNSVKGDIRGIDSTARQTSSNINRNLALAGAAVAAGLTLQIKSGIDSLVELERVNNLTAAALESTGNVAGQSVEGIRRRAEEMERMSGVDDKVIQNAENLLLTFPTITDNFEETLEAAVNLNAALGGGDEGLQGSLIQVAKAVSDPVRGMTALRRSGVSFTEAQQDQVKAMMEANDVLGAQGVILDALTEQFGGAAAAANEGIAGDQKAFADAIEDMQMALATGFLPLITRVSDAVQDLVADPEFIKRVEGFGGAVAGAFDEAIDFAEAIPWDSIGSALTLAGTGAKAAMDAFKTAPGWLQTAVLTGWGLNKLTGGTLGRLAIDFFKNRGSTPANPLFVEDVTGGIGVGGKGPKGGVPGGIGAAGLLGTAGIAAAGLAALGIVGTEVDKNLRPTEHRFNEVAAGSASRQQIEGDLNKLSQDMGVAVSTLRQRAIPLLESGDLSWAETVQALREQKGVTETNAAQAASSDRAMLNHAITAEGIAFHQKSIAQEALGADRAMLTSAATQAAHLSTISGIEAGNSSKLGGILAKKSNVNVNVAVTNQISVQEWQRVTVANLRATTGSGGFI